MQNNYPLISLFQNNSNGTNKGSGYKYKLMGNITQELDVPIDNFTLFSDGLLSYIDTTMREYYGIRDRYLDEGTEFDSTLYSPIIFEKIDKCMIPVIVDINLEFADNASTNFYADKFIYYCIYGLQDILMGMFQIPKTNDKINKTLISFVLESDPFSRDGKQFISIRFQFPHAKVNIDHLNRIIIKKFNQFIIDNNLIKLYLHQTPLNTERMIPDIGEYISMYGCKRKNDDSPFFLRNIYSLIYDAERLNEEYDDEKVLPFYVNYLINKNEIDYYKGCVENGYSNNTTDEFSTLKASMSFSPDEHSLVKSRYIDLECLDIYERIYNIPLILSVYFCSDVLKLDDNVSLSPAVSQESPGRSYNEGSSINNDISKFQMLNELMPLISRSRFTEYFKHDWLSIGKAIHTIYNGNPAGLAIFEHFTEDIVLKSECESEYNKFCSEMLDIRTIRHYASVDNQLLYDEFNRRLYWNKIMPALSLQELDFARFAMEILCLLFVYDRNNDIWWFFDGTRLVKDTKAYILTDYISSIKQVPGNDKITKVLYAFKDEIVAQCRESNDRFSKGNFEAMEKGINALIKKLSNLAFVNKIIAALQVCMYDDYLYNKTDENPQIMACKDCILECFESKIIHRQGKLQDYITKSTHINFPTTFTIDHPKVKFMIKYYGQVHTDPELCHFFLKTLASLLKGGNDEKFFINWIGDANASKSQVLKFLQAAFGDYAVIIPNHIITLNIGANTGKPEPALERAKGARAAIAAETDRSEKWHVGHIKKFTSGDDYDNRTLNKEGGQRSASFQLIAMSNIDLDAPNADEAYESRYVKIPFLSKWVDNAPIDEGEQYSQRRFPVDLTFSTKIKFYAQAQLWLMYYYYPIYKREGIRMLPEIVKTVTLKHQRDIDVIFNFIHDRLQIFFIGDPKNKIPDRNKKSSIFELHRVYKSWYRGAYGNDISPLDQFKFRDELSRRVGNPDEYGNWYGISIKQFEQGNSL